MSFQRTLTVLAAFSLLGACNNSSSSGVSTDSLDSIQLAGAAAVATYACTPYTVTLVDGNKTPHASSAALTVALSGVGSGRTYASQSACQNGTVATSVDLAKGQQSATFYFRTAVAEALTFTASAKGVASGSLAVQTTLLDLIGQAQTTGLDSIAETFSGAPLDVVLAGSKVAVADARSSRVLLWNKTPVAHTWADVALGQPSPGTNLSQTANGNTLSGPQSVWTDGNRIAVADTNNCRVLIWNSWPTQSAQPAEFALGQAAGPNNLLTHDCNVASSSLHAPTGVWSDGTHLFVADANNARVLIWNSWPSAAAQPADVVLGQADMNSRAVSAANANTMSNPTSVYVVGTKLFVADPAYNRVLVWNAIPTQNDQPADFALGQPSGATNLTGSSSAVTAAGLYSPRVVRGDGTHLFVADTSNNRVLVWNSIPASATGADFALGQDAGSTNLTTANPNTTAGGLRGPTGVASNGNLLFVADGSNDRVLIWNTFPSATQLNASVALGVPSNANDPLAVSGGFNPYDSSHFNGYGTAVVGNQLYVSDFSKSRILVWNSLPTSPSQPADFALGQPAGPNNLVSYLPNPNGVAADSMFYPVGVSSDGVHLFVADYYNQRVLIWNHLPTSPVPADLEVGKPALNSNASATVDANNLTTPYYAVSDGNMLFVNDYANHRVMVWKTIPTQSGQPADFALGQPDMNSHVANNGGISASTLDGPAALTVANGHLFVSDSQNYRLLIWNTLPTASGTPADVVLGQPDFTTATSHSATVDANTLSTSLGMVSVNGHLYVGDLSAYRVLVWNSIPTVSGAPADAVYGQASFTTSVNQSYASPTSFVPVGLASDGARLFISDEQWGRLLILPIATQP